MNRICSICGQTYECDLEWLSVFAPCELCCTLSYLHEQAAIRYPDLGAEAYKHADFLFKQGNDKEKQRLTESWPLASATPQAQGD